MVWKPGQSGNPAGSLTKEKPLRDALRMELAAAELDDEPIPVKPGTMPALARAMINKAQNGDVPPSKPSPTVSTARCRKASSVATTRITRSVS